MVLEFNISHLTIVHCLFSEAPGRFCSYISAFPAARGLRGVIEGLAHDDPSGQKRKKTLAKTGISAENTC